MRILALLVMMVLAVPIRAAEIYVAVNGNDAWTGKSAAPNAAKTDGPLASLEGARDAVRRMRTGGTLRGPVTIYVRGGDYQLPRTLNLEAQDSGTPQAPVLWRAYRSEKPRLLGGRFITGFVAQSNGVYTADVGKQGFAGINFRQLFMNGERQHLARYPNFDPKNPYGGGWAYAAGKFVPMYAEVPGEDKRTLHYRKADDRPWADPTEGEVMVFPRYNWWNNIIRIAGIDRETRKVTLTGDASYAIRPGDRYYVRGLREELDAPGEWYLDRKTATLYFIPPTPIAKAEVYAPTLETILSIGPNARNITFQGFTFEACEGTAVNIQDAVDCRIAASTLRNVGGRANGGDAAVKIQGGGHCGVFGCDIYQVGSNAVLLIGGDRMTLTPANHYAVNNYIHHTGVFYKQGVGVNLSGVGSRAANNLIHDCPRFGIGFGGNDLVMENNHIRHVNLETSDTGAFYTGGRDWVSSRGSIIRYNYIHDILGYGMENGRWISPHFAWGVYLDDNTGGVDVIGNIIVRTIRGGIHLHNGRDNKMENNILVDHQLQQVEYNGWAANYPTTGQHMPTMIAGYEKYALLPPFAKYRNLVGTHPRDAVQMSGNEFQRNIVYYKGDDSRLFKHRNLPLDRYVSDNNLYFHFGKPLLTGVTEVGKTTGPNMAPNAGFEEGTVGTLPANWKWNLKPTDPKQTGITDQVAHSGTRSLRLDGASGKEASGRAYNTMVQSDYMPAKPGQVYRISVWMKADKPGTKAGITAQTYKANTYHWAQGRNFEVGTEWKEYDLVFTFPEEGSAQLHPEMRSIYIRLDMPQDAGTVWADDVAMRAAEPVDEWQAWKAKGFDTHSLVADPLFVNPAKDDYRLKPNSPAFKLGFKPIPVDKIGPFADPLRASWPIVEAEGAREKPLVSDQPAVEED